MNYENYFMWLTRVYGIGNLKLLQLIDSVGGLANLFNYKENDLKSMDILDDKIISKLISPKRDWEIEKHSLELQEKGIEYISIFSHKYPKLLKEISNPPLGFYVKGNLTVQEENMNISIIGSRKCSEYGRRVSYEISRALVDYDFTVVSGMADGIDSMAHKGTLSKNGNTIAVLGCGVDICYPLKNGALMEEIIEKGCVISEFHPGTGPLSANFPIRNRIISGLSRGIIVVEAGERSGTTITANCALNQGRELFAVPGSVYNKYSKGTNSLFKDGAHVAGSIDDILNVFNIEKDKQKVSNSINEIVKQPPVEKETLDQNEKIIYDCISTNPISIDEIVIKSNSSLQLVQFGVTTLEIKEYIKRLPGQKYIRT